MEMNGREIRLNVCVDTGFTGEPEIRIPYAWIRHAHDTYMIPTEDSNGNRSWAPGTLEGKITRIGGLDAAEDLIITLFQDGDPLMGLTFLRRGMFRLDGFAGKAILSLP
jgi:hypothetical protein